MITNGKMVSPIIHTFLSKIKKKKCGHHCLCLTCTVWSADGGGNYIKPVSRPCWNLAGVLCNLISNARKLSIMSTTFHFHLCNDQRSLQCSQALACLHLFLFFSVKKVPAGQKVKDENMSYIWYIQNIYNRLRR